jgi:hypothetical protein
VETIRDLWAWVWVPLDDGAKVYYQPIMNFHKDSFLAQQQGFVVEIGPKFLVTVMEPFLQLVLKVMPF